MVEIWSIGELEVALRDQLCSRYLRAREGRHGILLLVHRRALASGWVDPDNGGMYVSFGQVVQRLQASAAAIAGAAPDAPHSQSRLSASQQPGRRPDSHDRVDRKAYVPMSAAGYAKEASNTSRRESSWPSAPPRCSPAAGAGSNRSIISHCPI